MKHTARADTHNKSFYGEKWTAERIPDQSGRLAIVTGANSGLGEVTARELARAGARVVLACRNLQKGEGARPRIETAVPGAQIELEELDLASLDSDARVIELSSSPAYRLGRIAFDNLDGERRYFRWSAYTQSKLANLLFMLELDRRLRAAGSTTKSLAAHPGYAATNLQSAGPPLLDRLVMGVLNRVIAQSAEMGALSTLYAATQPGLEGGTYIGPDGFLEQRGHPKRVWPNRAAQDENVARRLWDVSEQMTAVSFDRAGAAV